ncbi:cytochrome ubiquinol oxidase subunit I, partial [bacterium]|nr:cytochrome ubiquinol oxidase subunit I [bacterium]
EVTGLDAFPHDERPPVLVTHLAFQVMVGIGTLLAGLGAVILWARWRKKDLTARRSWLKLLVALTPLGFVALEAGWIVTEVGRQPWILYRVLRTADAVTPVPGLGWSFALIVTLYLSLGALAMFLLGRWFVIESERGDA